MAQAPNDRPLAKQMTYPMLAFGSGSPIREAADDSIPFPYPRVPTRYNY